MVKIELDAHLELFFLNLQQAAINIFVFVEVFLHGRRRITNFNY